LSAFGSTKYMACASLSEDTMGTGPSRPSNSLRRPEMLAGMNAPRAFHRHPGAPTCTMGLEGIVSKRVDAPYRSGPSKVWLKSKNPASEAVRREREEEWR